MKSKNSLWAFPGVLVFAFVCGAQQSPAPATGGYRMGAGDEIEIRFLYNPELNERAPIRPDGRLSVPLMGEISVEGKTVAELTAQLQDYFLKELPNPGIVVQVRGFGNLRVFVGGEVARPGVLPLIGPKTVLEAIVESGGLKDTSRRNSVLLIRRDAQGNAATSLVALEAGKAAPGGTSMAATTALQPFDVILVPESGISKLDRAVDQYIRRMIPGSLTGGFTYLAGSSTAIVH